MPTDPPKPQAPGVTGPSPYVGGGPVTLTYQTAVRMKAAVKRVEGYFQNGPPGQRRKGGTVAAGAWGYVAGSVSGASGSNLGGGTAVLCSRSGNALNADGDTVTFYNAGGAFTGPVYVKLGWTDGDWSVDVAICS